MYVCVCACLCTLKCESRELFSALSKKKKSPCQNIYENVNIFYVVIFIEIECTDDDVPFTNFQTLLFITDPKLKYGKKKNDKQRKKAYFCSKGCYVNRWMKNSSSFFLFQRCSRINSQKRRYDEPKKLHWSQQQIHIRHRKMRVWVWVLVWERERVREKKNHR